MPLLSINMPRSDVIRRAFLGVKRTLSQSHEAGARFTIEIVTQTFPTAVVDVVTTRVLEHDDAKALVRYIWKCKADPRLAVRAVDARGQERYRFDASGAWTLQPEQPVIRLVPVGLRRSIHRMPDLSA